MYMHVYTCMHVFSRTCIIGVQNGKNIIYLILIFNHHREAKLKIKIKSTLFWLAAILKMAPKSTFAMAIDWGHSFMLKSINNAL